MKRIIIYLVMLVMLASVVTAAYGPSSYSASSSTSSSSSSSGGGGGGGSTTTTEVSIDMNTAGTTMILTLSRGQKFTVSYASVQYPYKVDSITGDIMRIQTLDTFETSYLFKGLKKGFDYDSNGKDDVSMTLESVTGNKAVVTFKSILTPEMPALLPIAAPKPRKDAVPEEPELQPTPATESKVVQTVQTAEQPPVDSNLVTGLATADTEKPSFSFSGFVRTPVFIGLLLLAIVLAIVGMIWLPRKKYLQ